MGSEAAAACRRTRRVPLATVDRRERLRAARRAMRVEPSVEERWRIFLLALEPGDRVAVVYE